jgi:hypothetical protein
MVMTAVFPIVRALAKDSLPLEVDRRSNSDRIERLAVGNCWLATEAHDPSLEGNDASAFELY